MSNWQNEDGEPYMDAAALRFEAALDAQYDEDRWFDMQDEGYGPDEDDECQNCGSDEHPTDECNVEDPYFDPREDQHLDGMWEA